MIAALPEKLQERCLAAPGLLAQIIVSKYCDHLPLYRQEQIYWNRHRVKLRRRRTMSMSTSADARSTSHARRGESVRALGGMFGRGLPCFVCRQPVP